MTSSTLLSCNRCRVDTEMTAPPDLSFLSVIGTPDTRGPRPRAPESQLPPFPHIPGRSGTLENSPTSNVVINSGGPGAGGVINPGGPVDGGRPKNPQDTGLPGPLPQRAVKYPAPEMGDLKVTEAIATLADANIQVVMPGEMVATPMMEGEQGYRDLQEEEKVFLRVLEKCGRPTKAAEVAGLSRGTFYNRRARNDVFKKYWDQCLGRRAELFEDEAIRRAVNGVRKQIYYKGAVCGSEQVYSDTLLAKLLEGNMPEKYRQNHKVEIEGTLGVATLILPAVTSAEEWAAQNSGVIINQEPEDEYK